MNNNLGQSPAFAGSKVTSDGRNFYEEGMSKRFYAACTAMQGILANQNNSNHNTFGINSVGSAVDYIENLCTDSYRFADELLRQELYENTL